MTRPKKSAKKDTTKARSAKRPNLQIEGSVAEKTATELKKTRPKPRPTYKGATADHDADERVASAALMMLGHDKGGVPVVKNNGAGDSGDDDDSVMDDEEEEDEIVIGGDGLTNEVGFLDDVAGEDAEEKGGNDDDTSSSISLPPSPTALPTFDIEFEVPCGIAVRDVTLRSSDTWTLFIMKISEVMGCSHNALPPLGYIPSWKPAKAKASPKILDGPETLAKLVKEAREMIAESKAKNKGKGVVKAWSIQLVDLFKAETNSGKTIAKTKAAAAAPEPIDNHEAQEYKIIEKIKKANECNAHPGQVHVVVSGGEHISPTHEDLAIWAHLVSINLATIDQPPAKLNLADRKPRTRRNNQNNQGTPGPSTPGHPNVDPQNPMAQMMMGIPMMMAAMMQQQQNRPVTPTFEQPRPTRKTSLTIIPSSDDTPDLESTDYPRLFDWLKGVDDHPTRGRDHQDYSQWAIPLQTEGYLRLDDFQQLSPKDLRETCDGMNAGTARRLLGFAKEDVERLDKESRRAHKRARQS